jgi:hypothetical protein
MLSIAEIILSLKRFDDDVTLFKPIVLDVIRWPILLKPLCFGNWFGFHHPMDHQFDVPDLN